MGYSQDARRPVVYDNGQDNPSTGNCKPSHERNRANHLELLGPQPQYFGATNKIIEEYARSGDSQQVGTVYNKE